MIRNCPNCGEVEAICICTWTEILKATEIRRRQDRDRRLTEGKPVLVDETKRPE